jgi:hypothetical protein
MAKSTSKKTARKSKYLKRYSATDRGDLYEIEKNPPPFVGRWDPERAAVITKVDATLKNVHIGEAFIIPAKYRATVFKYLRDNYPADKFATQIIPDNPDKLRVYRLAYPKKA